MKPPFLSPTAMARAAVRKKPPVAVYSSPKEGGAFARIGSKQAGKRGVRARLLPWWWWRIYKGRQPAFQRAHEDPRAGIGARQAVHAIRRWPLYVVLASQRAHRQADKERERGEARSSITDWLAPHLRQRLRFAGMRGATSRLEEPLDRRDWPWSPRFVSGRTPCHSSALVVVRGVPYFVVQRIGGSRRRGVRLST